MKSDVEQLKQQGMFITIEAVPRILLSCIKDSPFSLKKSLPPAQHAQSQGKTYVLQLWALTNGVGLMVGPMYGAYSLCESPR